MLEHKYVIMLNNTECRHVPLRWLQLQSEFVII